MTNDVPPAAPAAKQPTAAPTAKQPTAAPAASQAHKKSNQTAKPILSIFIITLWTILVFYLVQFLLAFPFRWFIESVKLGTNLAQLLYNLTTYAAAITIIIFVPKLINKKWRTSRKSLGLVGLPTFTDLGLAPAGLVIYIILSGLTSMLLSFFPWFNAAESQSIGFNLSYGPERLFALFAFIVVAPIAEEIIFRGYLYGKTKSVLTNPNKHSSPNVNKRSHRRAIIIATLVTSFTFGLLHLVFSNAGIRQFNVATDVFIMSIVLCLLREISGTIYAGIILHMLKNAIACFVLLSFM